MQRRLFNLAAGSRKAALLWWAPAVILLTAAALIPDSFLEGPSPTYPGLSGIIVRLGIVAIGVGYIVLMLIARALTKWIGSPRKENA